MKKSRLLVLALGLSLVASAEIKPVAVKTVDPPVSQLNTSLLRRMGCACQTPAETQRFLSQFHQKVANVLHREYRLPVGIVRAGTQSLEGIMSSGVQMDMSDMILAVKPYDTPVILIGYPAF